MAWGMILMADNADLAQDAIDLRLQQALAEQRIAADAAKYDGSGAEECEDCGDDIPQARRMRLPGVTTCVACQTAREGRRV